MAITGTEDFDVTTAALTRHATTKLPGYALPQKIFIVDDFPRTSSGKIDEASLVGMTRTGSVREAGMPPVGPVEEFLADLWRDQLHCQVDRESDFFALGGTSLGAMELMLRLCREFDIELPLDAPFRAPVLRELAAAAEERILGDVSEMTPEEVQRLMRLSGSAD